MLYEALRQGGWKQAREMLSKATPSRKEGRARAWVEKVIREERGADWRVQAGVEIEEGRGMGTMEGNGAQILARRMKGKGMSWTGRGAGAMAKVRELLTNGSDSQYEMGETLAYRLSPGKGGRQVEISLISTQLRRWEPASSRDQCVCAIGNRGFFA